MRLPAHRVLTITAAAFALGCALWEPSPEDYALPPLEFPTPEIDVPLFELAVGSLWLAKSPIGSFYLFGSVLRNRESEHAAFGPEVEAAYAASHEVVREVDLASTGSAEVNALLLRYGTLKRPVTLRSRVSRETWSQLEQRLARTGRSTREVESMQPWLVSFALASPGSLVSALDPLPGIADPVRILPHSGKPVVALRTIESQFQMLASLPRDVQDLLLRSALREEGQDGIDPPLASGSPERKALYEHLVYRRNERMAERLRQIGVDGKVRFVEVELIHLLGERGIPSLLAQHGFKVSRLE